MDLTYGPEYERFRQEVRGFLQENWPPDGLSREEAKRSRASTRPSAIEREFRRKAVAAGYMYRSVPRRYGGSEQEFDILKSQVVREEFHAHRAPTELAGVGTQMLVPTLLEWGEEWQKERWIQKTIEGDYIWAQGYSEPGAGSDLASLKTRAELVGDRWVINGQKIWTSNAQNADLLFVLVRTEPNAPKHDGISYLLVEARQPGIEIRPLKQINGDTDFNEVFFTDAVTPATWIVGRRGEGWNVSRSLLKHERNMVGGSQLSQAMFKSLLGLARRTGAIQDPWVREELAEIYGFVMTQTYANYIQMSKDLKGEEPGLYRLMNKIQGSNIFQRITPPALRMIGDDSLYDPFLNERGALSGNQKWMNQFFGSLGVTIGGGTSNIQRNIIAERGLGLPRDKATAEQAK